MPKIAPFQAVRYATDTGDLTTRIAPPYDVLDEGPKQALLDRDPHNIVKIDLPVTPPKTVGPPAAYQQAGQTYRDWLDEGVLVREEKPALFAYEQEYTVDERTYKRRGVFAGVTVDEFNTPHGVWRHENTIKAGTEDRFKLMEATDAQLSPVFSIFTDPQGQVAEDLSAYFDRLEPTFTARTEHDGVTHRLWRITDRATIEGLDEFFSRREVFIADGHHRYTTALRYRQEHPEKPGGAHCLMVLVAAEDPGMIVRETHRVIEGLESFSAATLMGLCEQREEMTLNHAGFGRDGLRQLIRMLPKSGPHAMALHDPKHGANYLLTFSEDPLNATMPERADVWRELDVAVLHHLFIDDVLRPNFGEDLTIKYEADLDKAIDRAHRVPDNLLIAMQPTPLESVIAVSKAGEVMPPKSTYFFPKLATGLVIKPLD